MQRTFRIMCVRDGARQHLELDVAREPGAMLAFSFFLARHADSETSKSRTRWMAVTMDIAPFYGDKKVYDTFHVVACFCSTSRAAWISLLKISTAGGLGNYQDLISN